MPDSKMTDRRPSHRGIALGWRVSSRLLGVGALLLALEAPALAQLAQEPPPRAAGPVETEPVKVETEPVKTEPVEAGPIEIGSVEAKGIEAEIASFPAAALTAGALGDRPATMPDDTATGAAALSPVAQSPDIEPAPAETAEAEPAEGGREDPREDSGEDPTALEAAAEAAPETEAIAETEPIPTLAERCAAPEASLFPAPPPEEVAPDEAAPEEAAADAAIEAEAIADEAVEAETVAGDAAETAAPDVVASAPDADGTAEQPAPEKAAPDEVAIVEPDTALEELDREAEAEAAAKAAAEKQRVCQLFSADQQYRAGDLEGARRQYQTAKPDFDRALKDLALPQRPAALTDPEQLSPAGQVFLREAAAGQAKNLATGILIPLELLVQRHPEYIPGQVQLSQALVATGRAEEGLAVLAAATRDYPQEPALVKAHIALAAQQKQWMDAAMLARQFAQLNPDHPEAAEFALLAEENMARFQSDVRDRLRANTIANVFTGAISVALTGSIWNSLSAIQTTATMLRGEEGVGSGISKSIKRQVELVEDEEVVAYINDMGQKLAAVAGRDEFDYEFNVLMDPNINAFALPGGKIFVNAGAIAKTQSEAELAGLLSHELAHAVLSHGFQLVSDGSLLSDVSRFIPYGGFASNLIVLNYSRDMERQADELGTRILAASGYAADGLHGLMKTLGEETVGRQPLFAWLSTHPETDERVKNIETQIAQEGLDPYRFEGVEQHFRMRVKVKRLIEEWQERKAKEAEERPWWR